jgi:drug/metabolite transporter (DMT)-like permease
MRIYIYFLGLLLVGVMVSGTELSRVINRRLTTSQTLLNQYIQLSGMTLLGLPALFFARVAGQGEAWWWVLPPAGAGAAAPPSLGRIAVLSAPFSLVAYAANAVFSFSLARTRPSSAMSIEQGVALAVVALLTALLPAARRPHPIPLLSFCSICVVVGGVVMVGLADRSGHESLSGDVLAVISAVLAAMYLVTLQKVLPGLGARGVTFFLGMVGISTALFTWPVWLATFSLAKEPIALPPGKETTWLIASGFAITALFNMLITLLSLVSGPTFTRLMLIFSLPVALVVDVLLYAYHPPALATSGCTIICVGLISHEAAPALYHRLNRKKPDEALLTSVNE